MALRVFETNRHRQPRKFASYLTALLMAYPSSAPAQNRKPLPPPTPAGEVATTLLMPVGLPAFFLGMSKTDVMHLISGYCLVERSRHGQKRILVEPQSEANMNDPTSLWYVWPDSASASPIGTLTFNKGRLVSAERLFQPDEEPGSIQLVRNLFMLFNEDTREGRATASVTTRADAESVEITISFGRHTTRLVIYEGEGQDQHHWVSLSKRVSIRE